MQAGWLVLLPPTLVLILSILTKRVISSLIIGIVTAASIAANYNPLKLLFLIKTSFIKQLDISNIYIFTFLICLGILITMMTKSGGTIAYAKILKKKLHTKKSAETASIFLSFLFSIDDFFSTLTVGSIMHSITDRLNIPRVKLAFLIDSLAAPLVILIPVSSWIAMLTSQLNKAGISAELNEHPIINADPFYFFLKTIPFIFYSILIISSVLFIVYKNISYGPMKKQEDIAEKTGNLFGGKKPKQYMKEQVPSKPGSVVDFLLPIFSLVVTTMIYLLYDGKYTLFGGSNSILKAFADANIFFALFAGSTIAVIISIVYFITRKKIDLPQLPTILFTGANLMKGAIIVLVLSWMFGSILNDELHTSQFLAQTLLKSIPLALLPIMFFITAVVTAISTGSSWGTIAVLIPLAVPMYVTLTKLAPPLHLDQTDLLFPLLGAIFAGSVAGDHISPISSTSIMSTTSSGCYHDDHVKTQFAYAVPALLATCFSFLCAGIMATRFTYSTTLIGSLSIGILTCLTILYVKNESIKK